MFIWWNVPHARSLWVLCHLTGFARLGWGWSDVLATATHCNTLQHTAVDFICSPNFVHSEWFMYCLFLKQRDRVTNSYLSISLSLTNWKREVDLMCSSSLLIQSDLSIVCFAYIRVIRPPPTWITTHTYRSTHTHTNTYQTRIYVSRAHAYACI